MQGPVRSHNGESSGKEKQNRWSLRFCLNTVSDEAEVTCSGSMFQMQAPATGKARELMSRTAGIIRSVVGSRGPESTLIKPFHTHAAKRTFTQYVPLLSSSRLCFAFVGLSVNRLTQKVVDKFQWSVLGCVTSNKRLDFGGDPFTRLTRNL